MSKEKFTIPILFLIFNRPDTTRIVFDQIRKIKPTTIYIAADGPRKNKSEEKKLCAEAKEVVLSNIDWDCNVKTLFREENLGCGIAVSTAISWFFEHEEMGIILEDDTVPDVTFFKYCEELLNYYKDDESVLHISGNQFSGKKSNQSYYFSKLPFIWGWATWRRAWKLYNYDYHYSDSLIKEKILEKTFLNSEIKEFWLTLLKDFHLFPLSYTWDYQWFLSIWDNNGLAIQPEVNLVENIGFGENATHTTIANSHLKAIKANSIYKINHPRLKKIDETLQDSNFRHFFKPKQKKNTFIIRLKRLISIVKKIRGKIIGKQIIVDNNLSKEKYKLYTPYRIGDCEIGKFTYIAANSKISNSKIGKFCSIGPNFLCGWGIHPIHSLSTSPMFYSTIKQNGYSLSKGNKISERLPITIGNDVFIGSNVTVLDGVTIGDGAVIGAGAIVSKDIPPYAVAVGCPIKIMKYRFSENVINSLLEIKWWDWDETKLHEVESYFDNIEEFIKKYSTKS